MSVQFTHSDELPSEHTVALQRNYFPQTLTSKVTFEDMAEMFRVIKDIAITFPVVILACAT